MLAALTPLFVAVFMFPVFLLAGGWALFRPPTPARLRKTKMPLIQSTTRDAWDWIALAVQFSDAYQSTLVSRVAPV